MDDRHIKEFGLFLRTGHEHPGPETDDYAVTIPGMHGAHDMGSRIRPRQFNLPLGFFPEMTRREREKKIREFMSFLLDQYGKPRTFKLVFEYEPEKWYRVRYSGSLSLQRITNTAVFDLPLIAFDPFAYANMTAYDPDETYRYDSGHEYNTGLMYPNPAGFRWRYINHYSSVYNYSPYQTPLLLTIEGRVVDPRIENRTNGETIILDRSFQDEKIFIDGKRYMTFVADIDSETYFLSPEFPAQFREEVLSGNLIEYQRGSFIMLEPGQNDLHFYGGDPNATVIYQWLHRFM